MIEHFPTSFGDVSEISYHLLLQKQSISFFGSSLTFSELDVANISLLEPVLKTGPTFFWRLMHASNFTTIFEVDVSCICFWFSSRRFVPVLLWNHSSSRGGILLWRSLHHSHVHRRHNIGGEPFPWLPPGPHPFRKSCPFSALFSFHIWKHSTLNHPNRSCLSRESRNGSSWGPAMLKYSLTAFGRVPGVCGKRCLRVF